MTTAPAMPASEKTANAVVIEHAAPCSVSRSNYKTIVADPPWPMPETGKRTSGKKAGKYICGTGREIDAG